ncbi:MAG: DUF1499 domain-containing protein [Xanthobacteraceae bacterium]|nr:DUF1499 domain-containing protein [Xanthobacteraceae bacterium]
MQRRRFLQPQRSLPALWARRLAIFSIPVVLLAVVIARAGSFDIQPALVTFGAGLALAMLAILFAIAALVMIWIDGRAGAGSAFAAIAISLLLLAYPAYLGTKAYRLPSINDITTDPNDPPRLEAAQRLRTRAANSTAYPGPAFYQKQTVAYPDVAPLSLDVPPQVAYDTAYSIVTKRKWAIVDARPPQANREGIIQAVARTPIMGFRDDVVLRVRAAGAGSRIDGRSASRYGFHDFGANATRLINLLTDIDDAVPASVATEPAGKKPQKQPAKPAFRPAQPARR